MVEYLPNAPRGYVALALAALNRVTTSQDGTDSDATVLQKHPDALLGGAAHLEPPIPHCGKRTLIESKALGEDGPMRKVGPKKLWSAV